MGLAGCFFGYDCCGLDCCFCLWLLPTFRHFETRRLDRSGEVAAPFHFCLATYQKTCATFLPGVWRDRLFEHNKHCFMDRFFCASRNALWCRVVCFPMLQPNFPLKGILFAAHNPVFFLRNTSCWLLQNIIVLLWNRLVTSGKTAPIWVRPVVSLWLLLLLIAAVGVLLQGGKHATGGICPFKSRRLYLP